MAVPFSPAERILKRCNSPEYLRRIWCKGCGGWSVILVPGKPRQTQVCLKWFVVTRT
jgi:hypothetical protein